MLSLNLLSSCSMLFLCFTSRVGGRHFRLAPSTNYNFSFSSNPFHLPFHFRVCRIFVVSSRYRYYFPSAFLPPTPLLLRCVMYLGYAVVLSLRLLSLVLSLMLFHLYSLLLLMLNPHKFGTEIRGRTILTSSFLLIARSIILH